MSSESPGGNSDISKGDANCIEFVLDKSRKAHFELPFEFARRGFISSKTFSMKLSRFNRSEN